jgi:hypothetical protein
MFEIVSWTHYEYCLSAVVKTELDNFVWRLVVLYGSPYEDKKMEFISELHLVMAGWQGPTLIGGGYNFVRTQNDKSNGLINFSHASAFNEWINEWGLIENKDPSRLFTWSNNHNCPIMVALDRIFQTLSGILNIPWKRLDFSLGG